MTFDDLRTYCLTKPATAEKMPFGDGVLVITVGGKMFALIALDEFPLSVNLKCDPERALELREQYESVLPGYHMNKKHWNTVKITGELPLKVVKEMIDHSYILVRNSLPKKEREAISATEE